MKIVQMTISKSTWIFLAFIGYAIGVLIRFVYIFKIHPAESFLYSDMNNYYETMMRLNDPNHVFSIGDVLLPLGFPYIFLQFFRFYNSWTTIYFLQFFISAIIPLLLSYLAYLQFSLREAFFTLIISSLYFTFISYASFFLTENIFTLFLVTYILLLTISKNRTLPFQILILFVAGLIGAGAFTIRGNFVFTLALVFPYFLYLTMKSHGIKGSCLFLTTHFLGILLVIFPVSKRCTQINEGNFCLSSTNGALNFLQGHYGPVGHFNFQDEKRSLNYTWSAPPMLQQGYTDSVTLPFGPYDSKEIMSLALQYIQKFPMETLLATIKHVCTLFYSTIPWPQSHTFERNILLAFEYLFLVFLFFPSIIFGIIEKKLRSENYLNSLTILSIVLMAIVFYGDPRYRVPYDAFFIILASRFWLKFWDRFRKPISPT